MNLNIIGEILGTGTSAKHLKKYNSSTIGAVKEFHDAFNVKNNESPTLIEDFELRYELMKEENEEYLQAAKEGDLTEIFDACIDMIYVAYGTILRHGLQDKFSRGFSEIHASNMSKLGEDGKPLVNGENGVLNENKAMGKVLKGPNYFEPNLTKILDNE